MFNKVFLFLILVLLSSLSSLYLFQNTKGGFIVFGEILNDEEKGGGGGGGGAINIIEKNVMRNQQQSFNNTSSFDIELSDHYYNKNSGKVNLNNNFQFSSQPIVVINTNVFSCELEKIGSERICLSLSKCDEDNCRMKAEPTSNLIIIGKEPIYSLVTTSSSPQSTSIYSMQVKLQPGEYEIFPKNNDVISSNYCNEIEIDGVGFEEFTMGTSIPQDNTSVLCINISDGCYGMIKIGETKVCEINKVFINK
jgi:hypothetical protein